MKKNSTITLRQARCLLDVEDSAARTVNQAQGVVALAGIPAEAQVVIIKDEDSGRQLALIGADLIWFGNDMASRLRNKFATRLGVEPESICLTATHTHGSPQTESHISYGEYDPALVQHLEDRLMSLFEDACSQPPQQVRISFGQKTVSPMQAVNRRRMAWYIPRNGKIRRRVQNLPAYEKSNDNILSVISFWPESRDAQKPVAVFLHFTCHPVCDLPGQRGADYPGHIRTMLQNSIDENLSCLFLQGFCGDVRPGVLLKPRGIKDNILELIIGKRFRGAKKGDAEKFARPLAVIVGEILGNARDDQKHEAQFYSAFGEIPMKGESGKKIGTSLNVTTWDITKDISMVFAGAEMLSGLIPDNNCLAIGYSNGMVGYVAPEEEFSGGGYEIDGFVRRFGLPERFSLETGAAFLRFQARLFCKMRKMTDQK